MTCIHCGAQSAELLCQTCKTQEVLDRLVCDLMYYKEETCGNEALRAYMSQFENSREGRACIPQLLALFDEETGQFARIQWLWASQSPNLESESLDYLNKHPVWDWKRQNVLSGLLRLYARNDFVKPRPWCELILSMDGLAPDLYERAGEFFGYVAEYELADQCAEKLHNCKERDMVLFMRCKESVEASYQRLTHDILRYRTKKIYWPMTESRRKALAQILDQKGIAHPRVTLRPEKVNESDFQPIEEWEGDELSDYCAFWCEEVPDYLAPAKDIYQIGAVRVREGRMDARFESLIHPWKSRGWKKSVKKLEGVTPEELEKAEDVDLVMKRFFAFVGEDVLASTQALGDQGKLISRAARYTGMREIDNEFLDLLDYAADCDEAFDMEHNNRAELLEHFQIADGLGAAARAEANVKLYEALKRMES